jgi:hypothetical protein
MLCIIERCARQAADQISAHRGDFGTLLTFARDKML